MSETQNHAETQPESERQTRPEACSEGKSRTASGSKSENKSSLGILIAVLAFFFVVFLMCAGALMTLVSEDSTLEGDGIGVVEVTGTIASADEIVKTISKFSADKSVKAMLIRINSPGGSVSASQEIVEAIRTIKKPVVISMGDMAASGGYYVACAGPEIYANPGTLTGSIGVISQVMEMKDLMEFFKVKVHTIKTGELKDAGSPYREFNDTDRTYFASLGSEIMDQFVTHVSDARKLPKEKVLEVADGRVWTGREAHKLGLVDKLGGMQAAIDALREKAGITGTHTLVYPKKKTDDLLYDLLSESASDISENLRTKAQEIANQPEMFEYRYVD